ncbi:MAG: addiction module toxin, RelE/StbE family [Magnetococcales bacterium]|nr:addiction module toxin, RelE/StbE family [Magnetococcales bacterium]
MKLVWYKRAILDLKNVYQYIGQDNSKAAEVVATRIRESTAKLKEFPAQGRPGRVPGTRELVITDYPYLVPYKVIGEKLIILRVLHTSRSW